MQRGPSQANRKNKLKGVATAKLKGSHTHNSKVYQFKTMKRSSKKWDTVEVFSFTTAMPPTMAYRPQGIQKGIVTRVKLHQGAAIP